MTFADVRVCLDVAGSLLNQGWDALQVDDDVTQLFYHVKLSHSPSKSMPTFQFSIPFEFVANLQGHYSPNAAGATVDDMKRLIREWNMGRLAQVTKVREETGVGLREAIERVKTGDVE